MSKNQNITIDDIARDLGVSKTTVSRAISGKGRIGAATRERVQAYIHACNYRPSAAARALAESRTYNLALVLPRDFITLDLPFIRKSMSGICEEAFDKDYSILMCLAENDNPAPLLRTLDNRKVDGVILTRTVENDSLVELLIRQGMPFATMGSLPPDLHGQAAVEADHDHETGCYAFAKDFLAGREERVALLGGDRRYMVNRSRLSGFRRAAQELSIPEEKIHLRFDLKDDETCAQAVDELLAHGVRRFLTMDDEICLRVLALMRQRELAIPEQVELASLYDSDPLEEFSISALRFDAAELGRVACGELLRCIRAETFDAAPVLKFEICMRGSTR